MQDIAILNEDTVALEIAAGEPVQTILSAGTRIRVEIGKFEWLGRPGLYSEISVDGLPERKLRVDYHRLFHAMKAVNGTRRKTA